MNPVYFATTNKGKVSTVRQILSQHSIEVIHEPMSIAEPRTEELTVIAEQKVLAAFEKINKPVIAQDSGFYIHALNGFPKAFVNFATETIGIEGFLKLVEGKDRACEFRNCLAFYDGKLEKPKTFLSTIPGTLAEEKRGSLRDDAWGELWLIFIPAGQTKTLAEMSKQEIVDLRDHLHTNSYLAEFAKWYKEYNPD